jgi:translocation and assembly module TamB
LVTQNAVLQCDMGALAANADLPWPIVSPSLTQPWIQDADLDVQGKIDLARLIQAAPDLVQMQEQVQLIAGNATFSAKQRKTAPAVFASSVPPTSNYGLQLGGLQANVNGTAMRWDQALVASVDVSSNSQGQASFKADCTAEFCKIEGAGDLQEGQLSGQFDLAKMQKRLSQWFALPVESLSGDANCNVNWKQDAGNRLTANGKLNTTPVRIVNKYGQLDEPGWDGEFAIIARVDQGTVIQIDRGQVTLRAAGELLSAQVMEPISLVDSAPSVAKLPPAGIQLKLVGDLGGWQRRGQLFAGFDAGVNLGGKCEFDARGALDTSHIEVTQANFVTEPFIVKSGDTTFQESQMVGNFVGRIDSQNITRLQVDKLLVQSGSFALQASDEAIPNRDLARKGNAGYRIDPTRLMSAIRFDNSGSTNSASSDISVEGDVTGQIGWEVDPQKLVWKMISDAKSIRALQRNANGVPGQLVSTGGTKPNTASVLWEEPQAKLIMDGRYDISTGKLEIPNLQLLTEWIAYAGQANMTTQDKMMKLISQGNLVYDAALVAKRLRPWTGDYLTIQGKKTQPLEVTWTSSESGNWADSLQAKSQIGWDSANVIGIEVGSADVPLKIENGRFVSRAEIPVSQGVLRWNLDGDVAGNPIVIQQSPEKVIDNVAITRQMCQGWLKYVAPLLADVTSVQGNLSLQIDKAEIVPTDWKRQTIQGQLQVHGANVGPGPLADQVLMLVNQVRALRKGAGAADGGGQAVSWLQLPEQKINFDVEQGRVAHRNMQIQAGDVVINTSGSVGIDGQLELVASVPILKDWVDKTPMLQSLSGQQIQIPIRGTIQRPQMDLNSFVTLGQQLATSALQGVAQKQIDKGIGKLLGPLSQQLGPLQQGMQQMQQGVQQNMPQFPNLQNLPIPGFGNGGLFGGGQQPQAPQPQPQQ